MAAASAEPAELRVEGVSVRFDGLTALEDVSTEVAGGEVVAVIGPNGAGKTTLFNVICGFVEPASGTVRWRGQPLGSVRPHQLAPLGIARTLQGVGLFPHLTALENVMVGGDHLHRPRFVSALLGLPGSDRAERRLRSAALEALDSLGVADAAPRLASSLPYPVQKRVAIARSLVAEPALLLLDEPAGGLGADDVAELSEFVRGLRGRASVMLVEHRMDFVMSACDRVVVLDSGSLIASGTPAEIQSDERVLEAYLGTEQHLDDGGGAGSANGNGNGTMLEVESLSCSYGPVLALEDVSLDVAEGSITAVLGANGAGKSSLLKAISGLLRPSAGRIRFEGRDITRLAPDDVVRLGLAHVPEGGGAIGDLTVEENLRLGALWRPDRGDRAAALDEVYELFPPLSEYRKRPASTLSGGERQMLSLGRALMGRPRMLLLDEPSLGLAPIVVAEMIRTIRRLRESAGLTVLLVEQNAKSALSVADRGVVLNVGRVAVADDARTLAADDQLRHAYLGM